MKQSVSVLKETAMPILPINKSGFRPILSMSIMATTVITKLTALEITLVRKASLSPKPTLCQSIVP